LGGVGGILFPIWNPQLEHPWTGIDSSILNIVMDHLTRRVTPPPFTIWTALYDRVTARHTQVTKALSARIRQLAYTMLLYPHPEDVGPVALANGILYAATELPNPASDHQLDQLVQTVREARRASEEDDSVAPVSYTEALGMYVAACDQFLWSTLPVLHEVMPDRDASAAARRVGSHLGRNAGSHLGRNSRTSSLVSGGDADWAHVRTVDGDRLRDQFRPLDLAGIAATLWTQLTARHDWTSHLNDTHRGSKADGPLGHGAFGEVWRAVTVQTPHELRAVKHLSMANTTVEKLLTEAMTARMLGQRTNLVTRVYDMQIGYPSSELSMDLYQGELYHLIGNPLVDGVTLALLVARDMSEALAHIHACGILHADIKPENILYRIVPGPAASRLQLVLADFGLASWLGAARADELLGHRHQVVYPKVVVGTPGYMAPEQVLESTLTSTLAIDVWQLGITILATFYPAVLNLTPSLQMYLRNLKQLFPNPLPRVTHEMVSGTKAVLEAIRWCGFPSRAAWTAVIGPDRAYATLGEHEEPFPYPLPPSEPDMTLWTQVGEAARNHPALVVGLRQMLQFNPEDRSTAQDLATFWDRYVQGRHIEPRLYSSSEVAVPWGVYELARDDMAIALLQRWNLRPPTGSNSWVCAWVQDQRDEATPSSPARVRCLVRLTAKGASANTLKVMDGLKGMSDVTRAANRTSIVKRPQIILHDIYFGGADMSDDLKASAFRAILQRLQSYAKIILVERSVLAANSEGWRAVPLSPTTTLLTQPSTYYPLCTVRTRLGAQRPNDLEDFANWLSAQEYDAALASSTTPYTWFSYNVPLWVLASPTLRSWMLSYMASGSPVWFGVRTDYLAALKPAAIDARDTLEVALQFRSILPRAAPMPPREGGDDALLSVWLQRTLQGTSDAGDWLDAPEPGWRASTSARHVLLLSLPDRVQLTWALVSEAEEVQIVLCSMWSASKSDQKVIKRAIDAVGRAASDLGWTALYLDPTSNSRLDVARAIHAAWDVEDIHVGSVDIWRALNLDTSSKWGYRGCGDSGGTLKKAV